MNNSVSIMPAEMAALRRFCETCEDGEGYDVPKLMMNRLACIGLVRRVTRNIFQITDFGQSVIDGLDDGPSHAERALREAGVFAASVIKEHGMFDLSERIAYQRLEEALAGLGIKVDTPATRQYDQVHAAGAHDSTGEPA